MWFRGIILTKVQRVKGKSFFCAVTRINALKKQGKFVEEKTAAVEQETPF